MDLKRAFSDSFAIFGKNALSLILGGVILCVVGVACLSGPAMLLGLSVELNDNGQLDLGSMGGQLFTVFFITAILMVCVVMPLSYGLLDVSLKFATEGRVGGPGGVFAGLRRWGAVALFMLLKFVTYTAVFMVLLIPMAIVGAVLVGVMGPVGLVLAYLVLAAPYIFFETIWLYVPPLLYDREMGLLEALGEARRLIRRNGFLPTLVCIALPVIIAFVVAVVGAAFFEALGIDARVVSVGSQVIQYAVFMPWLYAVIVVMYMQAADRSADLEAALEGRQAGSRPPLTYGMIPQGPTSASPFTSATPFASATPFPSAVPIARADPFPSAVPRQESTSPPAPPERPTGVSDRSIPAGEPSAPRPAAPPPTPAPAPPPQAPLPARPQEPQEPPRVQQTAPPAASPAPLAVPAAPPAAQQAPQAPAPVTPTETPPQAPTATPAPPHATPPQAAPQAPPAPPPQAAPQAPPAPPPQAAPQAPPPQAPPPQAAPPQAAPQAPPAPPPQAEPPAPRQDPPAVQ